VDELRELLTGQAEEVPLDVAALQLATIEYPEVSVEPFLVLLDSYASEAAERIPPHCPGENFVSLLNEYLFDELGFHGNDTEYYHPANSCLNEVLTKRTGIPITLSLVYMEIGRRLGRNISGIGLPGHFLVHLQDKEFSVYIDPYHGGRMMMRQECFELSREITGMDLSSEPHVLRPVSKRHIAIRMLNNLRAVYYRLENPVKAIRVLDLLIEAMPESPEEYKQRGMCFAYVREFRHARADLEMYLRLAPAAADRQEVGMQLNRINHFLSSMG
jgi:regulator of sirC expression with transglutaminase-like and TPR domain